uniref:Remorin C-terminal domain-containing protein n=1 Tax=Salix viminalis TaxID=40686 RepID=A0A6N2MNI5_SALVM
MDRLRRFQAAMELVSSFIKAMELVAAVITEQLLGKPTPSKWDDAQKWLVGLSRGGGGDKRESKPRNSNADDRRLIAPVPQMEQDYSGEEDDGKAENGCSFSVINQYEAETKKVDCDESVWRINKPVQNSTMNAVRSVCLRDMGTDMTPIASQEPSRTATPIRATTPAARSPVSSGSSTPVRGQHRLQGNDGYQTGLAVTESNGGTASSPGGITATKHCGQEFNGSGIPENMDSDQARKMNALETRAMAWDEAERAKYMARYKREEVKIQGLGKSREEESRNGNEENGGMIANPFKDRINSHPLLSEMSLFALKISGKSRVKAERLKGRAQERLANKLASTKRIAEEKRANAEARLNEKAVKTSEKADHMRATGHLPSVILLQVTFPVLVETQHCIYMYHLLPTAPRSLFLYTYSSSWIHFICSILLLHSQVLFL